MVYRTVILTIIAYLLVGAVGCKKRSAEEEMEALARKLDNATEKETGEILEKMTKLSERQTGGGEKPKKLKMGKPVELWSYKNDRQHTRWRITFEHALWSEKRPWGSRKPGQRFLLVYARFQNLGPRVSRPFNMGYLEVTLNDGTIHEADIDYHLRIGPEIDDTETHKRRTFQQNVKRNRDIEAWEWGHHELKVGEVHWCHIRCKFEEGAVPIAITGRMGGAWNFRLSLPRLKKSKNGISAVRSSSGDNNTRGSQDGSDRIRAILIVEGEIADRGAKEVREGAIQAGKAEGYVVQFSPEDDSDTEALATHYLSEDTGGVIWFLNDEDAFRSTMEKVRANRSPCVIVDSDLITRPQVYPISTGNHEGGVLAARRIGELLKGRGKIIMLEWGTSVNSIKLRAAGFRDTIAKEFPEIRVVESQAIYQFILNSTTYIQDMVMQEEGADFVFSCNDSGTCMALLALRKLRSGDKKPALVGFGKSPMLADGLRKGEVDSLVVQDFHSIGYRVVKAVVQAAQGQPIPDRIGVEIELVTRDRLNEPKIRELFR